MYSIRLDGKQTLLWRRRKESALISNGVSLTSKLSTLRYVFIQLGPTYTEAKHGLASHLHEKPILITEDGYF